MEVRTLIKRKSLALNYENYAAEDVIEAISSTILGNQDGIRYRQLDALRKITEIKPLHFFPLRRNDELIYVMALAERIAYFKALAYHCFYVRYVSFSPSFSTKDLTKKSKATKLQGLGNSFMKKGMQEHAENFAGELSHKADDSSKRIYYAYVEETNLRSMNFTEFFFEPIRKFSIISYSNLFPKKDSRFSKLDKSEIAVFAQQLAECYAHHSFYFVNEIDLKEKYFTLKTNGKILVGVKAEAANWQIEKVPGAFGKVLQYVLPYLPVSSRIIRRNKFRFLTFDTLFCTTGNEGLIPILFRSVCAELKVYAGMVYFDKGDNLYESLTQQKNMGLLNKLFKTAKASVLARFINFTEEEIRHFKDAPVYFSGYDLS